jgi:predicted enzyme related to lactoylglutathione lyase
MLNLNSIMIGSSDPKKLSEFYEKVLEKKPDMQEGDWYGYSAGACYLSIGAHDKVKGQATNPERVIMNFETKEVKEEFARIKGLGGKVIAEPYQMDANNDMGWIATFADPEGNYFQLMSPWE